MTRSWFSALALFTASLSVAACSASVDRDEEHTGRTRAALMNTGGGSGCVSGYEFWGYDDDTGEAVWVLTGCRSSGSGGGGGGGEPGGGGGGGGTGPGSSGTCTVDRDGTTIYGTVKRHGTTRWCAYTSDDGYTETRCGCKGAVCENVPEDCPRSP